MPAQPIIKTFWNKANSFKSTLIVWDFTSPPRTRNKIEKSFDFMVTYNNRGEIFFSLYIFISGPKWKISNSSQFDSESRTWWDAFGSETDTSISDSEDNTLLEILRMIYQPVFKFQSICYAPAQISEASLSALHVLQ